MPKPFFQRLDLEPIYVAFEDILPTAYTAEDVQRRAVYKGLIHTLPHFLNVDGVIRQQVESRLRPLRPLACEGRLETADFQELLHAFLDFKGRYQIKLSQPT